MIFMLIPCTYAFNLTGTWKLLSIERQTKSDHWIPDCASPKGLLIYTAEGYMAAGINCMKTPHSKIPSFSHKDMTFYMGKYSFNQHYVIHSVITSDSGSLYGKNLTRKIIIKNKNQIILLVNKDHHLIRLKWQKIKKV